MTKFLVTALLASTALSGIAHAQAAPAPTTGTSPDTAATTNDTPPVGDQSSAVPEEAPPTPEEAGSQAAFLQAQVDALQAQLDALKKQMAAVTPSWKGAPQFDDKDAGFSFKPKGFAQFDAGYVGTPGPKRAGTAGGLNYNNLGFNTRARRLVLGAEGTLPGGFGYKVEFNFAQGTVDYEDVVLTYQRPGSPIQLTVGNFYPLSSLESLTSSRLNSMLERASFTDAFNYNRRLGAAIGLVDPTADRYTLTAGLFSQEINNTNFNRTGWQASVRGTFSPTLGATRLHLGANYQHRVAQRDAQNVQFRSRPFTQITDQRFVDTGAVAADGDDIVGLELGAIHKSLHFAGEAQQLWVRGYRPGQAFGLNNGAGAGAAFYADNPSFFSGYAEVGYYFTGETRGYKGGKWDRTKVLHPFDQGGWGALQGNFRFDYLDLNDRVGPITLVAPNYVNGGKQIGYQASLIWNPMDYLRFQAQYAHGHYEGGPRAATVNPNSTAPLNKRPFDADSVAVRAQVEF